LLDNKPNSSQFNFLNKKGTPQTIKKVCPNSHHQEKGEVKKIPDDALQYSPSQQ
jgi:hypothetical protein